MALQTDFVVGCGIGFERFVRVVTFGAGKPRIAFAPAFAGDQPIGRRSGCRDTGRSGELHIPPCAVTGAAELDLFDGTEMAGVEDFRLSRRGGPLEQRAHLLDVIGPGTVAGLAPDAGNEVLLIEAACDVCGGGVAAEALQDLRLGDWAIHGLVDAGGRGQGSEGRYAQSAETFKIGDSCFVEPAVRFLEEIGLADAACAEGPGQWKRLGLAAFLDRVFALTCAGLYPVFVAIGCECHV